MIRTSISSVDVDHGMICGPIDSVFNIIVPEQWKEGIKYAIFVKNFNDGTIKVIPTKHENVALLRIKTKDLTSLQKAMSEMILKHDLKSLYSTGLCKEITECYTEIVVKNDKNLIEKFIDVKMKKNEMFIEDAIVIFLNKKYRRMKVLVEKTGTKSMVKRFLSLNVKKDDLIQSLSEMRDGIKDKKKATLIQELQINIAHNIL